MIIIRLNTTTRLPVRLLDVSGNPLTGITSASILGGVITVISPDGVTADVSVSGANWFEISAAKAPGLYHFQLPAVNIATKIGPTQVSIQPIVPYAFIGVVLSFMVEDMAASAATSASSISVLSKLAFNRWKIVNNQLIYYDTDRITPLFTFNLFDDGGTPSMTRIFERVPTP